MRTGRSGAGRHARSRFIRGGLLCLFMALLGAAGASAGAITKGPCLLRVYQNRVALLWESDTEGPWRVSYGRPGATPSRLESTGMRFEPKGGRAPRAVTIHKVWLENLRPGQVYRYRIVGDGGASDIHTFRTVPAKAQEVKFIVYGDSRSHPDRHRRLVERMIRIKPDFVVHTGDLVDRGKAYEQWGEQFFEPLRGLVESVPIYIAKGNHEGDGGNFERLLTPPGEENDFTFDYGCLHYICADNVSDRVDDERLLKRIVGDAGASRSPWKFVSYHEPSLNFGGHDSDWQRDAALPAFAGAGVDFVIAGHSHLYERIRPVAPPEAGGSYVTYITSGGGGASTHDIEPMNWHAAAKSVCHFCVFHIRGNRLTMDAVDEDGKVIDHLEVTKQNGRLNSEYLQTALSMQRLLRR
ncbi:MAG: metallophosphoesterase [Sedimentisphaerales bacterium]|nr:metallophosphoesterase [Sedimentisphaerales bacterium]